MRHLTIEKMLAYVAGKTREEDSFKVELHLSECEECVRKVHTFYAFRENFDELWGAWTAKSHAEEMRRLVISESVAKGAINPKLQGRLQNWAKNITGKTEAALEIMVDSSKKAAKVIQEGLEGLCGSGNVLSFSPVPVPVSLAGFEEKNSISVESQLPSWARVTIDPSAGRLVVQAERYRESLPLIALISKKNWKAEIKEFRCPEQVDYILAEFEEIKDGQYILLMESTC